MCCFFSKSQVLLTEESIIEKKNHTEKQQQQKAFIWFSDTHLSQFDYTISCVPNASASNHLPSPPPATETQQLNRS